MKNLIKLGLLFVIVIAFHAQAVLLYDNYIVFGHAKKFDEKYVWIEQVDKRVAIVPREVVKDSDLNSGENFWVTVPIEVYWKMVSELDAKRKKHE